MITLTYLKMFNYIVSIADTWIKHTAFFDVLELPPHL